MKEREKILPESPSNYSSNYARKRRGQIFLNLVGKGQTGNKKVQNIQK